MDDDQALRLEARGAGLARLLETHRAELEEPGPRPSGWCPVLPATCTCTTSRRMFSAPCRGASMTELAYLTLAEASSRMRRKELSPVDYTRALLDRIDAHDAGFNAFLLRTPEMALRQARQAEADIQAGNWRGPLHGIPYGLKDIIDVEGLPTTGHSRILADNLARADAVVTQKLRAAGPCCWASCRRTSSRSAGRASICPGRPRGTRGIGITFPEGRRAAPGRPWPPASSPLPWGPTRAAPCATPHRCAASSA